MPTVKQIIIQHDQYITSTVALYSRHLDEIVTAATARTISELHRRLKLENDGTISATAANQRVLRSIDSIFEDQMEAAGYSALSEAYAKQFAGQLPFLDDILDAISEQLKTPLPDVRDILKANDKKILASQQLSTIDNLQMVVDQVAASAKRQALFGVAGLPVSELSALLAKAFAKTTANASAIAETLQVGFLRTVADKAYRKIEEDLPGFEIKYEYDGPLDELNRAVCRQWESESRAGKRWTRDDIDKLDNGPSQPKPVMIWCGGVRCRHLWVIAA